MEGQPPTTRAQPGTGRGRDADFASSSALASCAAQSSSPPSAERPATTSTRRVDVKDSASPTAKRDTPTRVQEQADDTAAEATPAPARRRVRLHRDALQSIFAFLDRKDFARLTQISKEWLSVAVQMPSRQWSCRFRSEAQLAGLLASPLRRHVRRSTYWTGYLSASQQQSIAERMAHLDELDCYIRLTSGMAPLHWPAKLTKLQLSLRLVTEDEEEISSLMSLVGESLVRQAPMVAVFNVSCLAKSASGYPISAELLTPLLAWPQLKQLTFSGRLSSSAYPILRRMAHLTFLQLCGPADLVDLLSLDGPVPPLEEIRTSAYLAATRGTIPLLVKLPTLRRLGLYVDLDDSTPLVPLLRQLHTLHVMCQPTCQLDSLVSALHQATQLTDLRLEDAHMLQAAHLAAILPPMRRLTRLRLALAELRSLDFLSSSAHPAETLTYLHLVQCPLADQTQLRHLRPLCALVELRLDRCFTSPMDGDTRSALTPGGAGFLRKFWPHLRTFECSPK